MARAKEFREQWNLAVFPDQAYAPLAAVVGDSLVLSWVNTHDVVVMPAPFSAPGDCGKAKSGTPLPVYEAGGVSYSAVNFTQPGTFYAVCSVGMHCYFGQHQQITVTLL
ncbi:hypothetical protein WJX81_004287 [Elliptochloris bilobata]|uniref:Phytocyanin domain-containing protein n=1 Tax=Elliptochloris bilobata TaxID=381761 RepID=A0AAW1QWQ7_9CHLO